MVHQDYSPPALTEIGSLHELTLQNKDFTGTDGINLVIVPGAPPVSLGPVSP